MIDEQRRRDREALLKRRQEFYREIDEGRKRFYELRTEIESHLPIEEQFARNLQRYIEAVRPQENEHGKTSY